MARGGALRWLTLVGTEARRKNNFRTCSPVWSQISIDCGGSSQRNMHGTPNKLPMAGYHRGPSSPCPRMSPAAMNLHQIHQAYKSGSITPQKKAQLKDQIIGSASKMQMFGQNQYQRQIFNMNIKNAKSTFSGVSRSSPALFESPMHQKRLNRQDNHTPLRLPFQQDYSSPLEGMCA